MSKTIALLCALVAMPVAAADRIQSAPAASEPRVIHIDANTQIRVDPRLRSVTGTDTAGAGASGSMEERHRRETQSGAAGPDDEVKTTLPEKNEKAKKPR